MVNSSITVPIYAGQANFSGILSFNFSLSTSKEVALTVGKVKFPPRQSSNFSGYPHHTQSISTVSSGG